MNSLFSTFNLFALNISLCSRKQTNSFLSPKYAFKLLFICLFICTFEAHLFYVQTGAVVYRLKRLGHGAESCREAMS